MNLGIHRSPICKILFFWGTISSVAKTGRLIIGFVSGICRRKIFILKRTEKNISKKQITKVNRRGIWYVRYV